MTAAAQAAPAAARWAARRGRWSRALLAVVGGAGLGLGHSPYDLPWLGFLALPLIFALWRSAAGVRGAAFVGWAAGVGFFALTLSWIVEPFMVDPARTGWMAPFALVGICGGLSLFWAGGLGLARALAPAGGGRGVVALADRVERPDRTVVLSQRVTLLVAR